MNRRRASGTGRHTEPEQSHHMSVSLDLHAWRVRNPPLWVCQHVPQATEPLASPLFDDPASCELDGHPNTKHRSGCMVAKGVTVAC